MGREIFKKASHSWILRAGGLVFYALFVLLSAVEKVEPALFGPVLAVLGPPADSEGIRPIFVCEAVRAFPPAVAGHELPKARTS